MFVHQDEITAVSNGSKRHLVIAMADNHSFPADVATFDVYFYATIIYKL